VLFWVFVLGANLGSFLNVVVYRLPRGMPLALSVSRCPKCANPIAPRDNIPIVSWLWLRGRCRACGQAISPRYPLVEAAVGGLLLLLFVVELLSGGHNLPLRPPNRAGFMDLFVTTPWDLVGIAGAHACLLYLLLAIALIEGDRRLVPWKLATFGMVLGFAFAPFLFMTVHGELAPAFVQAIAPSRTAWLSVYLDSFLAAAAGLAAGAAWGVLHSLIGPPPGRRRAASDRALPVAMALVGVFLGWQGATSVATATLVLRGAGLLAAAVRPPLWRMPSTLYLLLATILHVTTWRWHEAIRFWPTRNTSLIVLACVCAAAAIALAWPARTLAGADCPQAQKP
jgi:leader peptidase (prepilin peptidase)/N-methyltransferase